MRVKVLCLGRSAKELELGTGATVEQALNESGFKEAGYMRTINGHPAFDSDALQEGDVITLTPNIKGGA